MERRNKILCSLALLLSAGSQAAIIDAQLVHAYQINNSTADQRGGPSIALNPGSSLAAGGGVDFDPNSGPSIFGSLGNNLFGRTPVADYSVEFAFRLDSPSYSQTTTSTPDLLGGGPPIVSTTYPIVKILDFNNRQTDQGLYINNDGFLQFTGLGAEGFSEVLPDTDYHLIFTRSNDLGIQVFFDDGSSIAASTGNPQFDDDEDDSNGYQPVSDALQGQARIDGDELHFFLDDTETADPNAEGSLRFVNLYAGTISQAEAVAIFNGAPGPGASAVPVPGSLLLMAMFAPLLRRSKKASATN